MSKQLTYLERMRLEANISSNRDASRVLITRLWFDTDPYGAAVAGIKKSLELALDDGVSGAMSAIEYATLMEVGRLLSRLDPDIEISPRVG